MVRVRRLSALRVTEHPVVSVSNIYWAMAKRVIHVSEEEAASEFASLISRVRAQKS